MIKKTILFILAISAGFGLTINIPGDYATIQQGIDNAANGDILLIQPGTYHELLNTQGKQIELQSLFSEFGDPAYIESTVISGDLNADGVGDGTVITIENEVYNENARITGVTIQDGLGDNGGGLMSFQSAPNISNCVFQNNSADFGGGLYGFNSQITIDATIFRDNLATGDGGGIYSVSCTVTLNESTLRDNEAVRGGGVFELYFTEITNTRTLYFNNSADFGAAIFAELDNCQLINCTLAGNAALSGGSIYVGSQGSVTAVNSIFWGELPEAVYFNTDEFSGSFTISYSDIDGGEAGILTNGNGDLNWDAGNLDTDPLFVDPDNFNFHLTTDSPCIDVGNPDPQYDDPDGTINDMGAFFFGQIPGCTDAAACNYIPEANHDDGSCLYNDCNAECGGEAFIDDCSECVGGSTGLEVNYALDDCGVCFGNNTDMDCDGLCFGSAIENECGCVGGATGLDLDFCYGCTDPDALNYDPVTWIDDGSCYFDYDILGCTDSTSCNFNPDATYDDGTCLFWDCTGECGGAAYETECGCVGGSTGLDPAFCMGCTDPAAINYDPAVTIDDGSCEFGIPGDINQDAEVNVLDVVTIVDMILNLGEPTPYELNTGDVDCGGTLDIVDIVIIINCIINGDCVMGCGSERDQRFSIAHGKAVEFSTSSNILSFTAPVPVGGFQLETTGQYGLEASDLPPGWQLHQRDNILLAFDSDRTHPVTEFKLAYSGSLQIEKVIVSDLQGVKMTPVPLAQSTSSPK